MRHSPSYDMYRITTRRISYRMGYAWYIITKPYHALYGQAWLLLTRQGRMLQQRERQRQAYQLQPNSAEWAALSAELDNS